MLESHLIAAEAADSKKSISIEIIDLRGVTDMTDYFVIASGSSDRQVRAIADCILDELKKAGESPLSKEGFDDASWILLDYGDLVVHVFLEELRVHYDLGRLWKSAKKVEYANSNLVTSNQQ